MSGNKKNESTEQVEMGLDVAMNLYHKKDGIKEDLSTMGYKGYTSLGVEDTNALMVLCDFACKTIQEDIVKKVICQKETIDPGDPTYYIHTRSIGYGGFLGNNAEDRIFDCRSKQELKERVESLYQNKQTVIKVIEGKEITMKVKATFE